MKNVNLIETNKKLSEMTLNIKKAKIIRTNNINNTINIINNMIKEGEINFSNKKNAISYVIKTILGDVEIDPYTKRAVKIAKNIMVDGYKFKKELLSLAQMEQLSKFNISLVNGLMNSEDYLLSAKNLINSAKVEKTTKIFSGAKAKGIK